VFFLWLQSSSWEYPGVEAGFCFDAAEKKEKRKKKKKKVPSEQGRAECPSKSGGGSGGVYSSISAKEKDPSLRGVELELDAYKLDTQTQ
jgi:hypothetical protein